MEILQWCFGFRMTSPAPENQMQHIEHKKGYWDETLKFETYIIHCSGTGCHTGGK